eukprot:s383_g17.t1
MNLVPSNTLFLPVRGDVDTLPLLPQMNALELQPSEELIISSEDIRAMFYMFALPPVWYPYLAFNRAVPGDLGEISDDMSPLLTAYHAAGIPFNEKKSVRQATVAEVQGAEINGKTGLARPKSEKLGKYASATASLSGGGLCASDGLTLFGEQVAKGDFRGQILRDLPQRSVVCIGLFDGVGSLRVALEALKAHVLLHVSVQCSEAAQRIVETHFPDSIRLDAVESITSCMCQEWAGRASGCSLVIVGAGVPLELHGMRNDREPITSLHALAAFNMEIRERALYTRDAGVLPCRICASEISPCRRERFYWIDWALEAETGCTLYPAIDKSQNGTLRFTSPLKSRLWEYLNLDGPLGKVHFSIEKSFVGIFEPGWALGEGIDCLSAFTTAQPSSAPGTNPAGLNKCSYEAKERWQNDRHRFPPYQYRDDNLLWHSRHGGRMSTAAERERAMGLPRDFTFNCLPKNEIKSNRLKHDDTRMSLVGCAWSVPVVS